MRPLGQQRIGDDQEFVRDGHNRLLDFVAIDQATIEALRNDLDASRSMAGHYIRLCALKHI